MNPCDRCGVYGTAHDAACWREQVNHLYYIVNLFVNFDGRNGDLEMESIKDRARRKMDEIRAKNDPTYKRQYDPITGCSNS